MQRPRFSLLSLLVLITVAASLISLFVRDIRQSDRIDRLESRIQQLENEPLKQLLLKTELELAESLNQYGQNHPEIKRRQREIKALKDQLQIEDRVLPKVRLP